MRASKIKTSASTKCPAQIPIPRSRFLFMIFFWGFWRGRLGGGLSCLTYWDITAPFALEIRFVENEVKEFRDCRPV